MSSEPPSQRTHYSRYNRGTLHVGLGEKASPMNLSGRRFDTSAMDRFGYDVYKTDPLYKNIPLLINATPSGCIAFFSTSHGRGKYSIGAEMDGMWYMWGQQGVRAGLRRTRGDHRRGKDSARHRFPDPEGG